MLTCWTSSLQSTQAEARFNEALESLKWPSGVEAGVGRCKNTSGIFSIQMTCRRFPGTELTEVSSTRRSGSAPLEWQTHRRFLAHKKRTRWCPKIWNSSASLERSTPFSSSLSAHHTWLKRDNLDLSWPWSSALNPLKGTERCEAAWSRSLQAPWRLGCSRSIGQMAPCCGLLDLCAVMSPTHFRCELLSTGVKTDGEISSR